tara:strand:+ start:1017 stop:1196 length:180 start_codon:yes stop_codon:yes gene_type:complete
MSYSVLITEENVVIYGDGARSCIGVDVEFQAWLRANKDSLPDDIQAKIDAGELTIEDAD